MRTSLLIGAMLAVHAPMRAADTAAFDNLQTSYNAAVEKSVKPLRDAYLESLGKLRETYLKAANLEGANRVQSEIDAIKQNIAFAAPSNGAKPAAAAGGNSPGVTVKPPEVRWIAGKDWYTPARSKWTFNKDGTGTKSRGGVATKFLWKGMPSGLVQLTNQGRPGTPPVIEYVEFVSKSDAWWGTSETERTNQLKSN